MSDDSIVSTPCLLGKIEFFFASEFIATSLENIFRYYKVIHRENEKLFPRHFFVSLNNSLLWQYLFF